MFRTVCAVIIVAGLLYVFGIGFFPFLNQLDTGNNIAYLGVGVFMLATMGFVRSYQKSA